MIKFTLVLTTLLAIVFSLLQFCVNIAAAFYESQYEGLSIEVGQSWINPIKGTLSIADVELNSKFETYKIKELELKLIPNSLFSGTIEIEFFKIKQIQTRNRITSAGTQIFGQPFNMAYPSNLEISITLEEVLLNDSKITVSPEPVFAFESFKLQQLKIAVVTPELSNFEPTWVALDVYSADKLKWSQQGVELGDHQIIGLKQNFVLTKSQQLEPITTLSNIQFEQGEKETDINSLPVWSMNKVQMLKSELVLFDLHHDAVWPININRCVLEATTKNALHEFICALDTKGSTLDIEGNTSIYDPGQSSEINATLKGLNLVDLTAYFEPLSGYKVHTGMLNLSSQIKLDKQRLHANNELLIRKLKVQSVDESLAGSINKQLSMPLPMAIGVLKNEQDNIELSLPVDGELGSPELHLDHIYSIVTQKILKSALLFSIKNSFQPYTSMISLGQLAGEYLFAIRLNPLEFKPGSAELTNEHKDYLSIVNRTLMENPSYQLSLCGFSTEDEFSDRNEFIKHWKTLATSRSNGAKLYLEGLNPEIKQAVITCQPQVHDETPILEIGIN